MIAAVLAWALQGGWKWLAGAALIIVGLLWHGYAVHNHDTALRAAVSAEWQAALAKAEAQTKMTLASLQAQADAAGREAGIAQAKLSETLQALEASNAKLPNATACGLDADRVRLLNGVK